MRCVFTCSGMAVRGGRGRWERRSEREATGLRASLEIDRGRSRRSLPYLHFITSSCYLYYSHVISQSCARRISAMFGNHYMPPIASTRSESGGRKIRRRFDQSSKWDTRVQSGRIGLKINARRRAHVPQHVVGCV